MSNTDMIKTDTDKNDTSKPLVILIHGLHQRGFIMRSLAKRLRHYGYPTHLHDYHSLTQPLSAHSESLNSWLEANHNPSEVIDLVGHSLGGLVIRDFIHRYPKWRIGRVVTLGTPHLGSVSSEYVKRWISPLVGKAYENGLDGTVAPLPEDIELGVIAGNKPYGLGQIFLNYHSRKQKMNKDARIHDGTVYLDETRLPNATDHIVLPVSHTGMLSNKEVARQTAYFLENGEFKRVANSK